jgi:hypothetical protein
MTPDQALGPHGRENAGLSKSKHEDMPSTEQFSKRAFMRVCMMAILQREMSEYSGLAEMQRIHNPVRR